ncbi:MAG: hypothetical protein RML72_12475 [Bacteroidia bacterium]|nr:hypothetical protein [Bacteroidia bacterium]MDW8159674.1 hypothetical protein [Bacteroidia bacterium]
MEPTTNPWNWEFEKFHSLLDANIKHAVQTALIHNRIIEKDERYQSYQSTVPSVLMSIIEVD